jgi:predicted dehydrogenase
MTNNPPVGFGLLGAGLVAPFHARAIQATAHARLVGVADLDLARLSRVTGEFNCRGYASLDEMLADPAVQVVNILTPNHLHTGAVLQAARAGKHILVEKPPATSLRDMDTMQAACTAAGVKIGVVLQIRTLGAVQAMRRALGEGRFGKVYHADFQMKWYRPADFYRMDAWRSLRSSGSGVTMQQAIHYIDLLHYLIGPVKKVQAQMTNLAHPEVPLEDTVIAFMTFENGAQGVVQASTAFWPGTDARVEINGENGTAIMVGERIAAWGFREERPEDNELRDDGSAAAATGATGLAGMSFRAHQSIIEDMVAALENDREPMITLASARPTIECALAMYLSAKRDAAVDLPIVDERAVW